MSDKYVVAIVGRPNVGKSALFNRMTGINALSFINKAVLPVTGCMQMQVQGRHFTLLDTGGFELSEQSELGTISGFK